MDTSSVGSKSVATSLGGGSSTPVQAAPAPSVVAPETVIAANIAVQAPTPERIAQAVKQVNDDFIQRGQNLYAQYEKDQATGIEVVKVVDKSTQEVVSQIPPKEIIAIAEGIDQYMAASKGRLLSATA